ncbi:hypothetical protein [Prochlorococcus marinus]|uniref:hypothetical protein n=1 Tax=Prochlorococcus marinus TaxID=1219 RepID=UPI0022B4E8B8|nr:hypothetical protein [Prochlorococcus marinus]
MNLEFIELDLDWPSELSIFDLKNYILSRLIEYGEPLRWAITSVTTHSEKKIQIISLEVVLIINQDKGKVNNTELN